MRSEPYEVIEYKENYKIKIFRDDDAGNPRTEWDNIGQMICFHSRYNLGDHKHGFKSPRDFIESLVEKSDLTPEQDEDWDEISDSDLFDLALKRNIILPLYLYDHSGITMRCSPFSCGWDSGQVGWIYCSHKKALEEWSTLGKVANVNLFDAAEDLKQAIERATKYLQGEVKTYDMYLVGDVFGYQVVRVTTDEEGEETEEDLDSCWGFYGSQYDKEDGSWEHMVSEAKSSCDYDEKERFPLLALIDEKAVPIIGTEGGEDVTISG